MADKRKGQPQKNFQWESDFDRSTLFAKIRSFRRVEDGRTSYDGFDHTFWLPVLTSAIRAQSPSAQQHKRRCIRVSLSDPALDMNNPDKFIQRCEEELKKVLATAPKRFHILVHVTYSGENLLTWVKDGQSTIRWNPASTNKIMRGALASRGNIKGSMASHGIPEIPPGMTPILITTLAVDVPDAQRQAIDALDRFRAIVNLIINGSRSLNIFGFGRAPHAINSVRLGPYWTVHNDDGSLASEQFWYEPRWEHRADSAKFSGDPILVRRELRKWLKKSRDNPLAGAVTSGLLRYCRALDQHDTDAALLGLWGALENLTGTQNTKYDVTVSRVIRLFGNPEEAKLIADHLRLRRNATIHAAKSPDSEEVDIVLYHAESLVRRVLMFFIKEGKMFRDHDEALQFLDIDLDISALKARAELTEKFLEYRNRRRLE